MTESPLDADVPVEPTSETHSPYDDLPLRDGIGYHDPDAIVLDQFYFSEGRGSE